MPPRIPKVDEGVSKKAPLLASKLLFMIVCLLKRIKRGSWNVFRTLFALLFILRALKRIESVENNVDNFDIMMSSDNYGFGNGFGDEKHESLDGMDACNGDTVIEFPKSSAGSDTMHITTRGDSGWGLFVSIDESYDRVE